MKNIKEVNMNKWLMWVKINNSSSVSKRLTLSWEYTSWLAKKLSSQDDIRFRDNIMLFVIKNSPIKRNINILLEIPATYLKI